jgi:hypothetical protein
LAGVEVMGKITSAKPMLPNTSSNQLTSRQIQSFQRRFWEKFVIPPIFISGYPSFPQGSKGFQEFG